MLAIFCCLGLFIVDLFKSRRRLEAENLFLRHQLNIALRRAPSRLPIRDMDRALLIWMTRLWPSLLGHVQVVKRRQSFGGTARASRPMGDGSRGDEQGARGSIASCVS